ncbi:MAG: hypothetical protein AB7I30_06875 [Isosphaeraceae bacterium]
MNPSRPALGDPSRKSVLAGVSGIMGFLVAIIAIDSDTKWYLTFALLAFGIVVGVPWAIRTWKEAKGDVEETSDTAEGLLGPLEEAYASGELSEEEYRRIRSSVVKVAAPGRLSDLSIPQLEPREAGPPEPTPTPPDGTAL